MAIDILSVEPTVISRDLREKIVTIYGNPKVGKTTIASKFESVLLVGFEKGYNALSGVKAVPVNKWSEFKTILKQLQKPEAKEMYKTIVIDTADIAFTECEKYICQLNGVSKIGDIAFGQGYAMAEKEYDEALRQIPLMDYGLVLISHAEDKTFTDENGKEYNQIVPTLPKKARKIVLRMSDIIGYIRNVETEEGAKPYMHLRGTSRFEAGSRYKYIPPVIELSYENLVGAIAEAIDKQEKEDGAVVVDKKESVYSDRPTANFDDVMKECQEIITKLMENAEVNQEKIVEVIEKQLGKGMKLNSLTRDQVDIAELILDDLKDIQ